MAPLETEILKPRPSALPEDDWPEFTLHDVSVAHADGRPASLLAAYADCPLTVRGRLEAPGAQYLRKKAFQASEIVVADVTRFAYAEMGDSSYALWALGEAGWFAIETPSARWAGVYEADVQAVGVLYFLIDCNAATARRKGGGPSAELLYREYAEKERYGCRDAAEAEGIFHRHREFLLMSFLQRTYDIVWSNTPIYQTFRRQFPTDFERCKARHEGRFDEAKAGRASRSRPSPAAQESKTRSKTDEPPRKDDNWWESATLFEFMQKAVNQRALRAGRSSITVARVAALLTKRFEMDSLLTATHVLLVHGRNLCYMMDHPRRRNAAFFAAEPIYGELAAGHGLSAAEQRRAEAVELRRRDHGALRGEGGESQSSDTEEEEEVATPKRARRSRKGTLSVLRPKSSNFSGKGKGKSIPVDISDEEEEEDTPTHTSTGGKRKHNDLDVLNGSKRPRALSSTSTSTSTSSPTPPLPLSRSPPATTTATATATTATTLTTPLPTFTPNGPRDSWLCTLDGCGQRIYGCSSARGGALVREHLEDHAGGVQRAVGILWGEGERCGVSVSHLIRRIREMGEG